MKMQIILSTCLAAIVAAPGLGQSFNIDAGTAAGVPTAAFPGAAGQAGTWNGITTNGPIALLDLTGAASSVTLTRTSSASFTFNNTGTSGDFQALMDDYHDVGGAGATTTYTFANLAAGSYEVYTYAWAADNPTAYFSNVTVAGSTSTNPQLIGGALPAPDTFALGATHALHNITLAAPGNIVITVATATTFGTVNGVQIKKLVVASCSGDVNNSGAVDVDDLVTVILTWGLPDSSGVVDVDDLVGVILGWGPCP